MQSAGPEAHGAGYKLLYASGAVAAGVAAGTYWEFGSSVVWYACACALGVCAMALRGRAPWVLLLVALVALGIGRTRQVLHEVPAGHIERYVDGEKRLVHIEGVVGEAPRVSARHVGRLAAFAFPGEVTRFALDARALLGSDGSREAVEGAVWVRADGAVEHVGVGDLVRIRGFISRIEGPRNPGELDIRPTARARGVGARVYGCSAETIEVVDGRARGISTSMDRAQQALAARASAWTERAPDASSRALLRSMLFGLRARSDDPDDIDASFRRTGLGHLLALSGLHLGALMIMSVYLLKASIGRPIIEALVLIAVLVIYLSIVPVRAPIFRAAVMFGALGVGEALGRRHSRVALWGLAAVVVLLWRPSELMSAGFQLSFGIVLALIVLGGRVRARLFGERRHRDDISGWGACGEWVKDLVAASVCAWLVSAPIAAQHFGMVSPMTVPASVVGVPLAGVTLALGYIASVASAVHPYIGEVVGWPAMAIGGGLVGFVQWVDALGFSTVWVPRVSSAWTVGATMVAVWWMWGGQLRSWRGGVALVAVGVLTFAQFSGARLDECVVARVDMLAVGDGTCILVRSGDEAAVFDCGSSYFAIGERTVPDAVRALGGWRAGRAFVSHANLDHFNGLVDAARPLGIREVVCGEGVLEAVALDPDGAAAISLRELEAMGIEVVTAGAGDIYEVGEMEIEVVWPERGARFARDNDSSLVLVGRVRTEAGERRVVLCGDIDREGLAGVERAAPGLKADILEVPHHGSAKPEAYAFVSELDPAVALQSTGPRRMHDERWDDVKEGRVWLMTARDGAVWAEVRRDGEVRSGSIER